MPRSAAWRLGAALLFVLAAPVAAQDWPQRPVKIVVGFGPGSTPDLLARLLAQALSEQIGQAFVVENKPGAGGNIAAAVVAKAAPDGLTLGATIPGPLVVNPMTMDTGYDPKLEIRPVTIVATQPSVLAVNSGLGVATLAELIGRLKQNPGTYNYASIGIGSISHLATELVALRSGTEIVHVPFQTSADAARAITSNEAQLGTLPPVAVIPAAQAGQLRLLAVTTPRRWPAIPDVPTFAEAGLPGVEAEAWMALIAPARTPEPVVLRLDAEVKAALAKPLVQEQMRKLAFEPVGNGPEAFATVLRDEEARWRSVVDKVGLARR